MNTAYLRILLIILIFRTPYMVQAQVIFLLDKITHDTIYDGVAQNSIEKSTIFAHRDGSLNINTFPNDSQVIISAHGYKEHINSKNKLLDSINVFMEPWSIHTKEILVTASRWNNIQNSTSLLSINQKKIVLQNPQSAADLLNLSNGVYIQKSQQGGGSPMIRGFATNRLLYSVDGVRMNTAIFRGGNLQNVISLDAQAIERAEILLGPGSILYGSDAIGGVMKFHTLKPSFSEKFSFGGNGMTRYSSANNESTFHGDITISSKKFSSLFSITHSDYGDLKMGNYGPEEYLRNQYVIQKEGVDYLVDNSKPLLQVPSGYEQLNIMTKLSYQATKNLIFDYAFHHSKSSEYARYDRLTIHNQEEPKFAMWNYGPQLWRMHHLSVKSFLNTAFFDHIKIDVAYQFFEERRKSRKFKSDTQKLQKESVQACSLNTDFRKHFDKYELFYGLEYVFNNIFSESSLYNIYDFNSIATTPRYPRSQWTSLGAYISTEIKLNNLKIGSSVRYNVVNTNSKYDTSLFPYLQKSISATNHAVTVALSLNYFINDGTQINMNVGTAFRAPNVDDTGKVFDSEPGSVVIPNNNLKPEYAYNIDFGIQNLVSQNLSIKSIIYFTVLDNIMVRADATYNGKDSINFDGTLSQVQSIQNGTYGYVFGVQSGINYMIFENFSIFADVNWQKGKQILQTGIKTSMRHVAPLFGTVGLRYVDSRLKAELNTIFNGEVSSDELALSERGKTNIYLSNSKGNLYSPSWFTINTKFHYQFNTKYSLQMGIENILDKRYRPYSSGIASAGRNFIISGRITF